MALAVSAHGGVHMEAHIIEGYGQTLRWRQMAQSDSPPKIYLSEYFKIASSPSAGRDVSQLSVNSAVSIRRS